MRSFTFVPVFILALICACVCPATALAQSLDQLPVIDGAAIFGDRLAEVEAAALRLQSRGADVRVRTIVTYGPSSNLDQYEAELERNSPSWLGSDGYRKNNLIVVIICLQSGGQTGLYYGEYWEDVIGDDWLRIQTDVMNPLFREGDYAGGAIEGLGEIERLIAQWGGLQPDTDDAEQSSGGTALPTLAAIAAAVTGGLLYRNHKKNQAKLAAVRQKALLAKQAAAAGINELIEAARMLEIKVDVTGNKVAPEDAVSLRSGLTDARRFIDRSSQRYSELSHSAADPENPKLGIAELGAIEPEYALMLDNLRQARDAITAVETQRAALQQMVDSFPSRLTAVDVAIEQATGAQDAMSRAGFNTAYAVDLLARGRATLAMARDLASKRRFNEATQYAELAGAQIQRAHEAAEELPQKKREVEEAVPALAVRIERMKTRIDEGRALFERLSAEYAETTWTPIRGNGTEAETRVSWAEDALEDAHVAAGMEQQEWHKALELVAAGNESLSAAESLIAAISELEAGLMAARREAPGEIAAAQADVDRAWEYLNKYDEDIRDTLEDELRAAETVNESARDELEQEKPDYLRVVKLAKEANASADRILAQARDEHETAERLRAKAASALRDAQAKVAMVSRFIQVRHPFVRDAARNTLVEAREALRQAEVVTDVNARITLAARAELAADEAYSLAQRDVDSSQGASQPTAHTTGGQTPHMPGTTVPFPPTGSSSGGNRPWGSRPSSRPGGGGSIPRGGGGSSGWGSGGRSGGGRSPGRGGGSTGW